MNLFTTTSSQTETIACYIREHVLTNMQYEGIDFGLKTVTRSFRKGEVIRWEGLTEDKLYFVRSGQVELTIERDDEIRILGFYFEGEWLSDFNSLISGKSSRVRITALNDCEIEYFRYSEMLDAYKKSLSANAFGRHLLEKVYLQKSARERDLLTLTPARRFQNLVRKNPSVLMNIPAKKIAAYLGVKPESLSRIRKRLFVQKKAERQIDVGFGQYRSAA